MSQILLGPSKRPTPEAEPLTLEHPIIGEIAAAIAELLKRTESLADTLAGIAGILASEGMLTLDEDEPTIDEQIAAADIDVSDLSPVA